MHIRDLVKRIWTKKGLYASRNDKVRDFLKYFDDNPELCWDELIKVFREQYYDLFPQLIPPLADTEDKLLRITLIRKADLKKRQELNLVKKSIKKAKPEADEPELLNIAKLGHKGLTTELRKLRNLTPELRRTLQSP